MCLWTGWDLREERDGRRQMKEQREGLVKDVEVGNLLFRYGGTFFRMWCIYEYVMPAWNCDMGYRNLWLFRRGCVFDSRFAWAGEMLCRE